MNSDPDNDPSADIGSQHLVENMISQRKFSCEARRVEFLTWKYKETLTYKFQHLKINVILENEAFTNLIKERNKPLIIH